MANQDNPNIIQVEELVRYCGRHKHVFIYDCKCQQVLLEKFLKSCDITYLLVLFKVNIKHPHFINKLF